MPAVALDRKDLVRPAMKNKQLSIVALLPLAISLALVVTTFLFPLSTNTLAQDPPRTPATQTSTPPVATSTNTNTPVTPETPATKKPTETDEATETATITDTPEPTDTDRPLFAITPITTPTISRTATLVPVVSLPTATSTAAAATKTPTKQASTSTPTSTPTPTKISATATLTSTSLPPTTTSTPTPTPGAPKVVIVWPQAGTEIAAGQTMTIEAKISDSTGLERVELWIDGKIAGTQSPALKGQTMMTALFPWTGGSVGSHTLAVRALNLLGLQSDLQAVVIKISSDNPRLTILSPANGEQLPVGLQIMVQAMAEDPTGVERGELWVNGVHVADWNKPQAEGFNPIKAGFIQLPQVAMSFPWTPSAAGQYELEVRSFSTTKEQQRASDSVTVVAVEARAPILEATPSMMGVSGGGFSAWWIPGLLLLTMLIAFRIVQARSS